MGVRVLTALALMALAACSEATAPTKSEMAHVAISADLAVPVMSCSPSALPTGMTSTCTVSDTSGTISSYTWSATGRTGSASGTSSTYSLNTPGTVMVTVVGSDTLGNTSTNNATIVFTNRAPTVPTIACSPSSTTVGGTVTCTASGSVDADGGTITYNWSATGRVGSATGTSTTYSQSTAGTVNVSAYATDGQGGTSANSNVVAITFTNSAPTAPTVSCTPTSTKKGNTVTCTASGSTDADGDPITYNWSATGRTGAATGTSTTYSLSSSGTLVVSAYATDGQGGTSSNSNAVSITFTNH